MDIIITIIRQNKNTKNNYLNNAQNAENKAKMPVNRQNTKRNFGTGAAVVRVLVVRPFARSCHSFAFISPQTTATSTLMPNAVNCAT